MNRRDLWPGYALDEHALGIFGSRGTLGDVHGATADQGTTTCASAQFGQSHPNRHIVTLSLPALRGAGSPRAALSKTAIGLDAKQTVKRNSNMHIGDT
jgi:hypothetical protein